jgi:hypothetical protein
MIHETSILTRSIRRMCTLQRLLKIEAIGWSQNLSKTGFVGALSCSYNTARAGYLSRSSLLTKMSELGRCQSANVVVLGFVVSLFCFILP